MKLMQAIAFASLAITGASKDSLCENIYEGFRGQQRPERAAASLTTVEDPMTYAQYAAERKIAEASCGLRY